MLVISTSAPQEDYQVERTIPNHISRLPYVNSIINAKFSTINLELFDSNDKDINLSVLGTTELLKYIQSNFKGDLVIENNKLFLGNITSKIVNNLLEMMQELILFFVRQNFQVFFVPIGPQFKLIVQISNKNIEDLIANNATDLDIEIYSSGNTNLRCKFIDILNKKKEWVIDIPDGNIQYLNSENYLKSIIRNILSQVGILLSKEEAIANLEFKSVNNNFNFNTTLLKQQIYNERYIVFNEYLPGELRGFNFSIEGNINSFIQFLSINMPRETLIMLFLSNCNILSPITDGKKNKDLISISNILNTNFAPIKLELGDSENEMNLYINGPENILNSISKLFINNVNKEYKIENNSMFIGNVLPYFVDSLREMFKQLMLFYFKNNIILFFEQSGSKIKLVIEIKIDNISDLILSDYENIDIELYSNGNNIIKPKFGDIIKEKKRKEFLLDIPGANLKQLNSEYNLQNIIVNIISAVSTILPHSTIMENVQFKSKDGEFFFSGVFLQKPLNSDRYKKINKYIPGELNNVTFTTEGKNINLSQLFSINMSKKTFITLFLMNLKILELK